MFDVENLFFTEVFKLFAKFFVMSFRLLLSFIHFGQTGSGVG